jgi:hypothetical protein
MPSRHDQHDIGQREAVETEGHDEDHTVMRVVDTSSRRQK